MQALTPRDIKIGMREGVITLNGWPEAPTASSPFQQKRMRRVLRVSDMYFRRHMVMSEISASEGVSHQRITQILKEGAEYLLNTGTIQTQERRRVG